ncbi:MAG: DegV family protein [Gemmatimonadetes bacterium]|nr:DegV family protein [Gemmatimonadota bacterium]
MSPASAGITYLDGRRLSRSLLAAADWVDSRREDLNRINVFPVPDGDTGTNFAMTLRAGAEAVRHLEDASLATVASAAAEACMDSARGNSGLLLSQFFLGFRDAIGDRETLDTHELAAAIRRGADQLGAALDQPVEGTILTVCRDVAAAAEVSAGKTSRHDELLRGVLQSAWESLERTPDLLLVLREAGVVDAGAKGFVLAIEGVVRMMDGRTGTESNGKARDAAPPPVLRSAAASAKVAKERDFGFCTEVLVRSDRLPATATVRAALRPLGGSIVVLSTGKALKVHVHTDTPEQVFELARRWGTVEKTKAENVRAQHRALAGRAGITVVVDSTCDLPDASLERYGIEVVPIQVIAGDRTYLDRVDLRPDEIYALAETAPQPLTTSQPAPGAWARAFRDTRAGGSEVFCLTLAGALSGSYTSAQAAARSITGGGVSVFDSRTTSLGLGLLAIRAAELVAEGKNAPEIATELTRIRDQSSGIFTVDTFDQLLRSGRVGRARAWLGSVLRVKPILEIEASGQIVPLERVRGQEALVRRVLDLLDERLTPRPRSLRFGVVHADAEAVATRIRDDLASRFGKVECLVSPVTPAIGVHTGRGAWGVFYQVEDQLGN